MKLRDRALALLTSHNDEEVAEFVRTSLGEFAREHPGRAVELRIPPFRVVQILGGTTHRRGTPPAIVEMKPETWLKLIAGQTSWNAEISNGAISASGERSNLGSIITQTFEN